MEIKLNPYYIYFTLGIITRTMLLPTRTIDIKMTNSTILIENSVSISSSNSSSSNSLWTQSWRRWRQIPLLPSPSHSLSTLPKERTLRRQVLPQSLGERRRRKKRRRKRREVKVEAEEAEVETEAITQQSLC